MTKTKAQLRAEAVERLRELNVYTSRPESIVEKLAYGLITDRLNYRVEIEHIIDLLTDDCDTECYECARLAELVAENNQLLVMVYELANGNDGETNGIADGSPLVDELPERDALTLMRRGFGEMLDALGIDRNERGHCTNAIHTLADMVERDYVSREAYEDLRDEFVWMSAFLHRMGKHCGTKDVPSLKAYVEQLEAKVAEHESEERRMAPHDCGHIADMSAKSADCVREGGEMSEVDSREKLEADVRQLAFDFAPSLDSSDEYALREKVMKLLDRQAAITERHILTYPDERDEQIAELQREMDRLKRENISLARDLGECMAERDELKRENAKLSDDEFYLRCTLVDMNGEVVG